MKTPLTFALFCAACVSAGIWTGCKEQSETVNVSAAVQGLKSADSDAKVQALTELSKAGPEARSATAEIIPLLKDKDPLVRRLAAYTLGTIGPEASSALPALREAVNDPDPDVASDAIIALRSMGETNANVNMPNVMSPPP